MAEPGRDKIFVDVCQSNIYNSQKVSLIRHFNSERDKVVLFCHDREIDFSEVESCYSSEHEARFLIVKGAEDRAPVSDG